jgi:tetratricopeptide (TPR) repeat protein
MTVSRLACGIAVAAVLSVAPIADAVATDPPAEASCPKGEAPPVRAARAALDREPDALEPRLALSAALRNQGCYAAAVQVLEEGEGLHGGNEEFQARLRTARSNVSEQQYIEGLGRAEEAAKAQRNLLRCAQLFDLTACDEALKERPNDPQILAAQGDALLKAGRPAEAAAAYRRAAVVEPANRALAAKISVAVQQRARLAAECNTGSGAAAVQACDAALVRGATDEFSIQRRKGLLLQGMGESSRALDAYIAADSVKSGDRSVALGIVSLTDDDKRRDAIAIAARGSALLALGRGSDAAAALRQAQALAPGLPNLGRKLAAAERLARTEPRSPVPAAATVASASTRPEADSPAPARRYSNDAPATRSH